MRGKSGPVVLRPVFKTTPVQARVQINAGGVGWIAARNGWFSFVEFRHGRAMQCGASCGLAWAALRHRKGGYGWPVSG
jgi:hypothetical protein